MKKLKISGLILAILLLAAGIFFMISKDFAKEQSAAQTDPAEQTDESREPDEKAPIDGKDLIAGKETEIKEDTVSETIYLKKTATDGQAKSILNNQAEQLSRKHLDKTVHVKVIRNDKQIADATVPPRKKENKKNEAKKEDDFYITDIQIK